MNDCGPTEHVEWQPSQHLANDNPPMVNFPSTGSNQLSSEGGGVAIHDPVNELLDKYQNELVSSPPQLTKEKVSPHCLKRPLSFTAPSSTGLNSQNFLAQRSVSHSYPTHTYPDASRHLPAQDRNSSHAVVTSPLRKRAASREPAVLPSSPSSSPQDLTDIEDIDTKTVQTAPQYRHRYKAIAFKSRRVLRLMVQNVKIENAFKILNCTDANDTAITVTLQNSWASTDVREGDVVHIIGQPSQDPNSVIVNHANERLLIINPDILVTCTAVAESLVCERQVVLSQKVRVPGGVNKNMVYGSIIHAVIQRALIEETFSESELTAILETAARQHSDELILAECDVPTACEELAEKLETFRRWTTKYMGKKSNALANDRGRSSTNMTIMRAVAIEEEIWSPFLGLKGKVDVTVEASTAGGTSLAAMEIKTGKGTASTSHRAQTMLYTLLLAERHPGNTHPLSLLYYSDKNETLVVKSNHFDLCSLLSRRNAVARTRMSLEDTSLPPVLTSKKFFCEGCGKQAACIVYQRQSGEALPENAGIKEASDELELSSNHLEWFAKWDKLITLEAMAQSSVDPWWVERDPASNPKRLYKPARLCVKAPGAFIYEMTNLSKSPSRLVSGDAVIFSSSQHMAVARGACRSADDGQRLFVTTDAELLMSVKYRVDRDVFPGSTASARYNLISTLTEHPRLRDLVVDMVPPTYESTQTSVPNNFNFNKDQQLAIDRVLNARDFALILGMPGSGKTTTVAAIIAMLVSQGKSILVTGYTHSAVDNIVLKLLEREVDVLRIGNAKSMHHEVRYAMSQKEEVNPLDVPVIASTCLGLGHRVFSMRRFDYCIVDEASQITLPVCLGPLQYSDKFILVGDHYQLPPLVQNPQARALGLGESLFKRLCEAHPSAVTALSLQYRMCEDIMLLSSQLIYDGKLLCGNAQVANRKLVLPKLNHSIPRWLLNVIDPKNRVVFLDTGSGETDCPEEIHPEGVSNPGEVKLAVQICELLTDAGLEAKDLGVISVYRVQLEMLKKELMAKCDSSIEVLTADQSQGRDKECIIVSLVRSNTHGKTGDLLRDWRRLNVAFTRAKSKLIIIGSRKTLKSEATKDLSRFIELCESKNWIWPVEPQS